MNLVICVDQWLLDWRLLMCYPYDLRIKRGKEKCTMGRTIAAIAARTTELGQILGMVGDAVGLVIEHLDREDGAPQEQRGGYFCLAEDASGAPIILHARIGLVRDEWRGKYSAFSHEKAVRLAGRYADRLSWQSRDEAREMYGGAIRCKSTLGILSFSGLPEHADEAAMLLVAVRLGVLAPHDASNICAASGNTTYAMIMVELERVCCWNNGSWTVSLEPIVPEYRVPPGTGT